MKPSYILLTLAGSALSLSGQNTFSGPASGYVFDNVGHSVRAVLGVPGAAYLGSASQQAWDSVSVAPNGRWALGVTGLSLNRIPDLSQPASFTSIPQGSGPILRVAWSSDSTTAAIWSPTTGHLQRITGLDSAPAVHDPIDLTAVSGLLSGWSLSPDGRYLALSSSAPGASSVYLSDQDHAPVPIGSVADPGAVAFAADGASLFVFGGAAHQILQLDLPSGAVAGSFDASPFGAAGEVAVAGTGIRELPRGRRPGPPEVQDLVASADGARLYAMGGQTLCGYDLSTSQLTSCRALEVPPSSFQPMPGGILLLNYRRAANMPYWLLDGKAGQIYFVPAGSASADAAF
jgi:hypothetical protein